MQRPLFRHYADSNAEDKPNSSNNRAHAEENAYRFHIFKVTRRAFRQFPREANEENWKM
jgi:hypothetical protein